jgi:resuscitation-promoting factor RpfA
VTTDTTTAPESTPEPAEAAPTKSTATKTIKRSTRIATVSKPLTTTRTTAARTVAVRPAAPPAPTTMNDAPAKPATSQSAVTPVVDVNSTPATPPATATSEPQQTDETLPIVGGGALALLALGGAGYVLVRRRRAHEEEEWYEEETAEHEPVKAVAEPAVEPAVAEPAVEPVVHEEQPAIVAPSAFAWGNALNEQTRSSDPMVEEDDRMPGETWVQRAYRGPTPNNPSVSLRARLKRAAFFDKRERDVAAGKAEPVEMDAGLPEAMVEEQEREREVA